jgi:hypothetical protein
MGRGRFCVLLAVATILAALSLSGPAVASSSCSSRLLEDWQDGRIDRTYPVYCYRQALEDLPEDVRVYSTAQMDITRALQAELRSTPITNAGGDDGSGGGFPVLFVAVTAALMLAAGSLAAIVR